MAKKNQEESAPVAEPFLQNPDVAAAKPKRIPSLKLNESGGIDWESTRAGSREAFVEVVSRDQATLEMLGMATAKETAKKDALTFKASHIKTFLDGFAMVEAALIPRFIAAKSKNQIQISPRIASAACVFTEEEKENLGETGAEFANTAFPEWFKKFFLEIGPGAQFFGALGFITMRHTKTMLAAWQQEHGGMSQPVNGAVRITEEETPIQ